MKRFNFHPNRKVIIFSLALILPFVILEIWSINRLATLGVEINKMDSTASSLRLENQVLENEIAKKSSLTTIEQSADILGFQHIKKVEKIEKPNLAYRQ
jgi:cell division protein FtsL